MQGKPSVQHRCHNFITARAHTYTHKAQFPQSAALLPRLGIWRVFPHWWRNLAESIPQDLGMLRLGFILLLILDLATLIPLPPSIAPLSVHKSRQKSRFFSALLQQSYRCIQSRVLDSIRSIDSIQSLLSFSYSQRLARCVSVFSSVTLLLILFTSLTFETKFASCPVSSQVSCRLLPSLVLFFARSPLLLQHNPARLAASSPVRLT